MQLRGNWTGCEITLPHGLLLFVFALWPTIAAYRWMRTHRRFAIGCCHACGYDLRGSTQSNTCPECGAAIATAPVMKKAAA